MAFPVTTDIFPDISYKDITKATTINSYSSGIVKCQTEINHLVDRQTSATKTLVGLCWKVHISITTENDTTGYSAPNLKGEASQIYPSNQWPLYNINKGNDVVYRYKRQREQYLVYNRESSTLGSYTPPWSFAVLPIPGSIVLPNGSPFHNSNTVFVTVESLKENLTTNSWTYTPWSMDGYYGGERNVGGMFAREGLLYHDGVSDMAPKLVLADWFPSQDVWERNVNIGRGEYLTALVHMVIIG